MGLEQFLNGIHFSGGGVGRGSKPPSSRTLHSQLLPVYSWLPPPCPRL